MNSVVDVSTGFQDSQRIVAFRIEAVMKAAGVPNKIIAAALVNAYAESSLNPHVVGDGGSSVGVFQLNVHGAGAGMTVAERRDVEISTRKILDEYRTYGEPIRAAWAAGADIAELSALFCKYIERPRHVDEDMRRRRALAVDLFPHGVPEDPPGRTTGTSAVPVEDFSTMLRGWVETFVEAIGPDQASWTGEGPLTLQDLEGRSWDQGVMPSGTYTLMWDGQPLGRVDVYPGRAYIARVDGSKLKWQEVKSMPARYGVETDFWESLESATAQAKQLASLIWTLLGVEVAFEVKANPNREWEIHISVSIFSPMSVIGGITQVLSGSPVPMVAPRMIAGPKRITWVLDRNAVRGEL